MSTILAMDLGKFKSVACVYDGAAAAGRFQTIETTPAAVHDLIAEVGPTRVVIEVGPAAGWVKDLAESMGVGVEVANPNHEAWKWKNVKRKTDRDDALKLAEMSWLGRLPTLKVPSASVRQWRSLIAYRHALVSRRTAIKNSIRAILDRQGLKMGAGKSGWTNESVAHLQSMSHEMSSCGAEELWRGQLGVELRMLRECQASVTEVEAALDALAASDKRVELLRTVPGVGPRLAETVVAIVDDPRRFKNGKQVGSYAGLTPRQWQSGTMDRMGGISGRGNKLLRSLLVEVSWLMRRYNPWLRGVFDRVCRGSKTRRKVAVIAAARRLLVRCWAMLRDGTAWRTEPAATTA